MSIRPPNKHQTVIFQKLWSEKKHHFHSLSRFSTKWCIFETFLKFLGATSLWDDLEELNEVTRYDICEHGERMMGRVIKSADLHSTGLDE